MNIWSNRLHAASSIPFTLLEFAARTFLSIALISGLISTPMPALAYKLSPQGTSLDQKLSKLNSGYFSRLMQEFSLRSLEHFSEPVHEEITQRIFGCDGSDAVCADPDGLYAGPYVIAGVRWNDDPPFRLSSTAARDLKCKTEETIRFVTQPQCWYGLFRDAQKRAEQGKPNDAESGVSLLHRSHFGDLQFLHAMASKDGESPTYTQKKILMWAEFTWRVALKEYGLEKNLREVPIEGFSDHFGRSEWRVQDLFAQGNVPLRSRIHEVAFGSLLHMIQDSFARGHVDRMDAISGQECAASGGVKPGIIREFHAYGGQDDKKHGHYDSREAYAAGMIQAGKENTVEVGKRMWKLLGEGKKWEEIQPYISCVFEVTSDVRVSSPGFGFGIN